jgi:hypothetical protein
VPEQSIKRALSRNHALPARLMKNLKGFHACKAGGDHCGKLCKRPQVAPIARNVEIRHRMSQAERY